MANPNSTGGAPFGVAVAKPKVKRKKPTTQPTVQPGGSYATTGGELGPNVGGRYSAPAAAKPSAVIPYGKQPVTDGSTLTNHQLNQAANAATVTQYGPQDTQMQQQYGASDRLVQQEPQWWQNYIDQANQIGAQDAAAWQAARDQIAGTAGQFGNAAAQAAQMDQSAMSADAAIRGASVDPQAVVRAQQAAQVNSTLLGGLADLSTTLGANNGSYFRGQQVIGARQKAQAPLDEIAYRRANLDPQAAALAQQKGAYKTQYKNDTISNEQKNVLERAVFGQDTAKDQADIALKAQQLAQQAAKDRQATRTANRKLAAQKKENATDNARADKQVGISQQNADANTKRANKTTTGGKDRFGNTPKQRRAAQDSYTRANVMTKALPVGAPASQVEGFLVSKNVNPVVARAVAQMKANGYVDAKTARQLATRGIRNGYTTKKPKPAAPQFPTIPNGGLGG